MSGVIVLVLAKMYQGLYSPLCGASESVLIMSMSKYFDGKDFIKKKKKKKLKSKSTGTDYIFFFSTSLSQIRAIFQCDSQVYLHT